MNGASSPESSDVSPLGLGFREGDRLWGFLLFLSARGRGSECVCVGPYRFLSQLGRICGLSEKGWLQGFTALFFGGFPGSRFRVQCC